MFPGLIMFGYTSILDIIHTTAILSHNDLYLRCQSGDIIHCTAADGPCQGSTCVVSIRLIELQVDGLADGSHGP